MTETRKTLESFIAEHGLKLTVTRSAKPNPSMPYDMDHWKYVVSRETSRMTGYFSMGKGHAGKTPTLKDILYCLAADAAGFENTKGFEDWAREYGDDTDSRRTEKTYHAVEKQSQALRELLGDELYQAI